MPNEITSVQKLSVVKGSLVITKNVSARYDMIGDDYGAGTVSVTTDPSLIGVPSSVGTLGWAYFANLDATETIEVGWLETVDYGGVFWPFLALLPGEQCSCPLYSTDRIGARSEAGTARLEWLIVER